MTRAREVLVAGAAAALALALAGCGYQADYARAGAQADERFSVVVTEAKNADAIAADEVASGVRDELARRGALSSASYPRVEVQVLRQDERSESIARAGGGVPEARSLTVGLVARGWIRRHAGVDPVRDTGDLRASDLRAVDRDPGGAANLRADALHDEDARSAVARRLGERMARRILGDPVAPGEE